MSIVPETPANCQIRFLLLQHYEPGWDDLWGCEAAFGWSRAVLVFVSVLNWNLILWLPAMFLIGYFFKALFVFYHTDPRHFLNFVPFADTQRWGRPITKTRKKVGGLAKIYQARGLHSQACDVWQYYTTLRGSGYIYRCKPYRKGVTASIVYS